MSFFSKRNIMTVWFTKGYRNLYNAISDLKKEHPEINVLCSHSDKLFSGFYSADFSEFRSEEHTSELQSQR